MTNRPRRCSHGRRRSAADRNHLRHAQRQGGDLCHRRSISIERGAPLPLMISGTITDASGPHPLRPDHRGVLELGASRRSPLADRPQLRAGARDAAALRRGAGAPRRLPGELLSQRRPARTPSASTTSTRRKRPGICGEFARSGLVNIVGGCCGTTPDHIRRHRDRPSTESRRARRADRAALAGCPASSRSIIDARHSASSTSASAPTSPARPSSASLIKAGDYTAALAVARQQVESRRPDHRRQHGRGHARLRRRR